MAADRGRCVFCGARTRLHVDHITPWAAGGLTTMYNLAVLCRVHNKVKSNFMVDPDGYVHYRPFENYADPAMAAAILAEERRRRLYPGRCVRAAWSLR
jgi:HNH endonuclease